MPCRKSSRYCILTGEMFQRIFQRKGLSRRARKRPRKKMQEKGRLYILNFRCRPQIKQQRQHGLKPGKRFLNEFFIQQILVTKIMAHHKVFVF